MNSKYIKEFKKIMLYITIAALVFTPLLSILPQGSLVARADATSLLITGTGLENDLELKQSDWHNFNHPDLVERIFSSNNNFNFHKISKVKGFDLFALLEKAGYKGNDEQSVTFIAADGFQRTWTILELKSLYSYQDFSVSKGVKVNPVIGTYRVELFDVAGSGLQAPVTWADKALTTADLDNDGPRLYLGQASGNVSDINQMNFIRDLRRIVVGEERPSTGTAPTGGGSTADGQLLGSPFKHIAYSGAPYNIDAITGATLTIEGPGVESYRALSLRQIEEETVGQQQTIYREQVGGSPRNNTYEGIRVAHLLDQFVTLREELGQVVFRDKNRRIIASFSMEEIRDPQRAILVAYGVNNLPLVYEKTDAGYQAAAGNDDGCFKLVYNTAAGQSPISFSNVAYIYVEEDSRPGYEHNTPPYDDPALTNYVFALSGSGLGKEVNYTVAELEAMTDLHLEKEYGLSNSEYYWYYNTYKGIPLWDLLLASGLDENIDEATPVTYIAADYYQIPAITIGDLKYPDRWGYYEKDALDQSDGSFDGSNVPPLATGYPVLLSYGFDGYPYVLHPTDPGHNSGLRNADGPLRIIFGKRSYDHTNGSHQVKFAKRVIIGDPLEHTVHEKTPYNTLADWPLDITIYDDEGNQVLSQAFSLDQVEDMVYGGTARQRDEVRIKAHYFTHTAGNDGAKVSDLYEGIGINQLLFQTIGLPGTLGTVTFENLQGEGLEVTLDEIRKNNYFNEVNGANNLQPVLAFGKNGYPLVQARDSEGYVGNPVVNRGGPLMVLFGQTQQGQPGKQLQQVTKITVQVEKDHWAHTTAPYTQYGDNTLVFTGTGVRTDKTYSLNDLQMMQQYIFTQEYSFVNRNNQTTVEAFRGIDLYDFLRREVGLTAGADQVTFVAEDGYRRTFSLEEIASSEYMNEVSGQENLKVMLAYGKNETPLVPDESSPGYVAGPDNSGGPLRLVIGQTAKGDQNSSKSVRNVVAIEVIAAEGDSWKHNVGVYTQYLDQPVLRVTGSQVKEPRTFSLRQLQALDQHIIRDVYSAEAEVEGVLLWNLIRDVVGLADGVVTPSSIRVHAGPGYNQLQVTKDVMEGMINSRGERKDIVLGYALDGYPLVPHAHSEGYVNNNEYGPLRLYVEENQSMWTKWTDCIIVGTGNYEEPLAQDILPDEAGATAPTLQGETATSLSVTPGYAWTSYRNDNNSGLPWASVRVVKPDNLGGLWVGTNGGGVAYRNPAVRWTVYNTDNSPLPHNTVYDIALDNGGNVWFVGGSPEEGMGIVRKQGDAWHVYNSQNGLPAGSEFAQAMAMDNQGGIWFGTAVGLVYRTTAGEWQHMADEAYPASSVTVLTPDNKGGLWIGFYPEETPQGYQGGYAYRNASGSITVYSHEDTGFSGSWVRSISLDQQGGVWVARFGKVDYITPAGQRNMYEKDQDLLPLLKADDSIRLVKADVSGNGIWIGTTTSGLYHRNLNGTFTVNDASNVLPVAPFNSVWAMSQSSGGQLWIGTNGGVATGVFGVGK